MLSGNDSGFRVSTDGGMTWTRASIPSSTFFDMAFDMDTPFRVYGSVQDHGSYRAVVDVSQGVAAMKPVSFESAPGGEGSTHAIDPTNPNIVYSAGTYGDISRTDLGAAPPEPAAGAAGAAAAARQRDEHQTEVGAGDADELRGQWLAPMILSPHDPNTLYFGLQYLYRSTRSRRDVGEADAGPERRRQEAARRSAVSDRHLDLRVAEEGGPHLHRHRRRQAARVDRQGKEWTDLDAEAAEQKWVAKVLASRYEEGTVYLAQQGRYDDDFACTSTSPPTTARRGRASPAICRPGR